jgi:hypothetical protein
VPRYGYGGFERDLALLNRPGDARNMNARHFDRIEFAILLYKSVSSN